MKTYHFLPIFIVMVASYVAMHFYAANWLARAFTLAPAAAKWLRLALLGLALFSPFIMFLKRAFHGGALEQVYAAGYAWMGIIFLAALVFACSDLAALLLRRYAWFKPLPFACATLTLLAIIVGWALYGGHKTPDIKEVTVTVADLPPALEGLRIAQISDMHVDSNFKLRQYAAIADRINAARPDLLLITGDLIDPGITCREEIGELTARIKPRLGVFGSLGNHEYYYGLGNAMDCYAAFGIHLLKNDSFDLGDLRLIGLGDIHTEHLTREDVTGILNKHKDGKFTILLSHQPVFYAEIAATGNYLGFSGHTHRGQIFPFHIFTRLVYKYFYGLYKVGGSYFYVTSGAGTWGPPLRWLAPAEIPVITLRGRS
jgi:predicted MPP superfamily phosphohydrolase